jgi:hypothetical protein
MCSMTEVAKRRRTRGNGKAEFARTRRVGAGSARDGRLGGRPDGRGGTTRRQKRKYVVGKTKREVVQQLREMQGLVDGGVPVPDQQITVGAMLDQWLTDVLPGTVAKPTEQQYQDVVRLYIKPRLGNKKLRDLTPSDVTRMLRDMERRPSRDRTATARRSTPRPLGAAPRDPLGRSRGHGQSQRRCAREPGARRSPGRPHDDARAGPRLPRAHQGRPQRGAVRRRTHAGPARVGTARVGWDDVNLDPSRGNARRSPFVEASSASRAKGW